MTKDMGPFRDSQALSWLSVSPERCTDLNPPLIGPGYIDISCLFPDNNWCQIQCTFCIYVKIIR